VKLCKHQLSNVT